MRRSDSDLRDVWGNWLEAARFICEAQTVVSARLMLFATGGPQAAAEAHRMICEKVTAFSEARAAAEQALAAGESQISMDQIAIFLALGGGWQTQAGAT